MKRHIFILGTLIFGTNLVQPTLSMEEKSGQVTQSRPTSTLPQSIKDLPPYKHKNVAAQIKEYRAVYDRVANEYNNYAKRFKNERKNLYDRFHIPGLYPILLNGFSLVKDKITTSSDMEKVELALRRLEKLFHIAATLESQLGMSQSYFIALNTWLAMIADDFKGVFAPHISPTPGSQNHMGNSKKALAGLDQGKINTTNIISYMNFKVLLEGYLRKGFHPPLIIYTNAGTTLGYETIVNQSLAEPYGAFLALFDIENKPYNFDGEVGGKLGKKTSPHFSEYNGTALMLLHDLAHESVIAEAFSENDNLKSPAKMSVGWEEYFRLINKERIKLPPEQQNEKDILTRFLFLVTHEIEILGGPEGGKDFISTWHPPFIDMLFQFRSNVINAITQNGTINLQTNPLGRGSYLYKESVRDVEHILKGLYDLVGRALWPEYSKEEKALTFKDRPHWPAWYKQQNLPQDKQQRRIVKTLAVKYGMERFWESVIILVSRIKFFEREYMRYYREPG